MEPTTKEMRDLIVTYFTGDFDDEHGEFTCTKCGAVIKGMGIRLYDHAVKHTLGNKAKSSEVSEEEKRLKVKEYFDHDTKLDLFRCKVCKQTYKVLGPHLYAHAIAHERVGQTPKVKGMGKYRTLSREVIDRMIAAGVFGPGVTIEKFSDEYERNKLGPGNRSRFTSFNIPLTKEDLELLQAYFDEERGLNLTELGEKTGDPPPTILSKVQRFCIRLVAQHPELIVAELEEKSN